MHAKIAQFTQILKCVFDIESRAINLSYVPKKGTKCQHDSSEKVITWFRKGCLGLWFGIMSLSEQWLSWSLNSQDATNTDEHSSDS
jgi:hypothetical protein